jgi:hypothetical protein
MRLTFSSSSTSARLVSMAESRWSLAALKLSNAAITSCSIARASGEAAACLVSFMEFSEMPPPEGGAVAHRGD